MPDIRRRVRIRARKWTDPGAPPIGPSLGICVIRSWKQSRISSCIDMAKNNQKNKMLDVSEERARQRVKDHGNSADKIRNALGKAA